MGWFSHGYVFTQQPQWDRLRNLPVRSVVSGGTSAAVRMFGSLLSRASRSKGEPPFAVGPPTDFTLNRAL